jgi:hypothetical protein
LSPGDAKGAAAARPPALTKMAPAPAAAAINRLNIPFS